jgi:hypothetical protein
MQYTINQGINYVFASVVGDHTGYTVSILEVDRTTDNVFMKLMESVSSDMLSIGGIIDVVRPYLNTDPVENKLFIGVFTNNNRVLNYRLKTALSCRVSYLNQPLDMEDALTLVPIRITDGMLKIAPHLAGVIEADLQITKPDDIPHSIASLLQLMKDWEILKNGAAYP